MKYLHLRDNGVTVDPLYVLLKVYALKVTEILCHVTFCVVLGCAIKS